MVERAEYMAEKLKNAGLVGVDYDTLTVGEPPNLPLRTFNLVKYIQIKA